MLVAAVEVVGSTAAVLVVATLVVVVGAIVVVVAESVVELVVAGDVVDAGAVVGGTVDEEPAESFDDVQPASAIAKVRLAVTRPALRRCGPDRS